MGKRTRRTHPVVWILVAPFLLGIAVAGYMLSGMYAKALSDVGNERLVTPGWQVALSDFMAHAPSYGRQYAYYEVSPGQNLAELASYFGVSATKLASMNPGQILPGTSIKVPPVEHALSPIAAPNNVLNASNVTLSSGMLTIQQPYTAAQADATIPSLMQLLSPWHAISEPEPGVYLVSMPITISGNIRLDVVGPTVRKLELASEPFHPTCLCFSQAEGLIQDTQVTSYDPTTKGPVTDPSRGRSFVRDLNGRLDIIDSQMTYLGNSIKLRGSNVSTDGVLNEIEGQGGMYGVAYRISNGTRGTNIATGWVQGSTFAHNYIGAYTFGASGITWTHNLFTRNIIYGLDPHDDSDNALVTYNTFSDNGKHGFIMSKRCDYNVIEDNVSYGNRLHGFMLHDNSSYNLIENNLAYRNTDNYVIFDSNFNMILGNQSYYPRGSSVRISSGSRDNFVEHNTLIGGVHGVFVYGNAANVAVVDNTIKQARHVVATNGAQNVLVASNAIDSLSYSLGNNDRLIFGPNSIDDLPPIVPAAVQLQQNSQNLVSKVLGSVGL